MARRAGDDTIQRKECRRSRRRLLGVVALAVPLVGVGCTEEVDPDLLVVQLYDAGRFALDDGRPKHVEYTSRIQCEPGALFGLDYRIDVPGWRPGTVPIGFRWRHPEMAVPSQKLWGTETTARPSNPPVTFSDRTIKGRALWSLEHSDERKDGRYEFAIVRSSDGRPVASHVFEIEGC